MTTETSTIELRKMQIPDLEKELRELTVSVLKMRLGIKLKKEKDTARYRLNRRQIARVRTILAEKQRESLSVKGKTSTLPHPKK
ncbi:50S ribosomal protein L29 [Candidatus Peribacteria bacterium RIFOXYC2_FULL_58_10]|jgi:ribosomal protein L29|nr:MAG: 50S ribosomal protein L29 [Candidatus Peribacteria bacterium RIFOXYC2_FULL_58_10]OGJ84930.1 MAG: 50S ribosomal protein L29 [Candidatus Peribacteria bacterium RIFOXYD2_FULL_58_15]